MVQSAIKEGDPPRTAQLLEIDGLRTWIRRDGATVRAVDDVSLELRAGEIVGLVGESGSGKSMTGMSIVRLLPRGAEIVAGRVLFNGRDLVRASDAELRRVRGAEIGLVFQDPLTSLNPTLRIGDQVGEPLRIHRGLSRREARAAATEMLDLVRVPRAAERLDEYPHQLSGGLRQRVVIACALILRPRLLIADEPTTALDVTIQAQILELIASLQVELGLAVLLISHNMGVIANYSNRLAVMYAGRIVETGPTADVVRAVRHPYTSALLDAVPQLGRRRDQPLEAIPGLPPDLADLRDGCRFAPRCRYAQGRCREEDPPLRAALDGHSWACHFPLLEERAGRRGAPRPEGCQGVRPPRSASFGLPPPGRAGPVLAAEDGALGFPQRSSTASPSPERPAPVRRSCTHPGRPPGVHATARKEDPRPRPGRRGRRARSAALEDLQRGPACLADGHRHVLPRPRPPARLLRGLLRALGPVPLSKPIELICSTSILRTKAMRRPGSRSAGLAETETLLHRQRTDGAQEPRRLRCSRPCGCELPSGVVVDQTQQPEGWPADRSVPHVLAPLQGRSVPLQEHENGRGLRTRPGSCVWHERYPRRAHAAGREW